MIFTCDCFFFCLVDQRRNSIVILFSKYHTIFCCFISFIGSFFCFFCSFLSCFYSFLFSLCGSCKDLFRVLCTLFRNSRLRKLDRIFYRRNVLIRCRCRFFYRSQNRRSNLCFCRRCWFILKYRCI